MPEPQKVPGYAYCEKHNIYYQEKPREGLKERMTNIRDFKKSNGGGFPPSELPPCPMCSNEILSQMAHVSRAREARGK
jgi:hypothetical protein